MSDTLSDLQRYWQMQIQVVLPVLGAIILVVVFYIYSLGTPTQPQLLLVDEPVTTKKEKSLARKKAKQQEKKAAPANGKVVEAAVVPEVAKPTSKSKPESTKDAKKPAAPVKKSDAKSQGKKPTTKNTKKVAAPVARDEEKERAAAAERKEKARMKKEAESGEWVTVLNSKDKKQAQEKQAQELDQAAKQAIIDEAKKMAAEAAAKASKATKSSNSKGAKTETSKPVESSTAATTTTSKSKKSKAKQKKEEETPNKAAQNIPEVTSKPVDTQSDVRPKEPVASKAPAASTVKAATGKPAEEEKDKSLQEKLEEAMQPAFDELGEWEQAKPMKAKNVKKRARREK